MKDYKISNFIKALRKERKYTIAGLADECGIGIRGFNKWLKKTDREWSLDSLMILSEILDFKIIINGGMIEVMKNNKESNNLEKNTREVYSVYKDFGDYSIVNLYTPNSNLSSDEVPELLEDFFIFSNEIECKTEFPNDNPIRVYGLLNNSTNCIEIERLISIYPYKAESYYYFNLAPVISITEDGYEVVEEFEDEKMKLVKAGLILDDDFKLKEWTKNTELDKCILGFILLPANYNSSKDFIGWSDNLHYLYSEYIPSCRIINDRFFDRNRNEIVEDDILVNKGFADDMKDIFNEDDYKELDRYFREHETVRIEKFGRYLEFNLRGNWHTLDELNLLKWEKVVYEE